MSTPDQSQTDNVPTRSVHFKVITNVRLQFDAGGEATLDLPVDSEWIVYYDLHKTVIGQAFELRMSERQSAIQHTVETDSQFVNGFAGLDVLP